MPENLFRIHKITSENEKKKKRKELETVLIGVN